MRQDDDAARRLLEECVPDLRPEVRQRVLDDARGDPHAVVELARAWRTADASGADLLRRFPPMTERLRAAVVPGVEALPAACSTALLVAALDFGDEVAEILDAAGLATGTDLTAAVFDPAVAAGLVTLADGRLRFTHHLGKAAVVAGAAPGELEQAHTALGLTGEQIPHRRAWHRAQTATRPDEDIAAALESTATAAEPVDALRRLARAARLTPDPARRRRRLLRTASHAYELGRPELSEHLLASAEELQPGDDMRSHALRLRFRAEPKPTWEPLASLCATAIALARDDDQDAALDVLLTAAYHLWWTDPDPAVRGHFGIALRHIASRDPRYAAVRAVALPHACPPDPVSTPPDADAQWLRGFAAHALGDCPRAVDLLGASAATLRAGGQLGLLTHARGLHAEAAIAVGTWDLAAKAAAECLAMAVRTAQPVWQAQARASTAMLLALRGDADRAWQHAELVLTRFPTLVAQTRLTRGVALLTTASYVDSYEMLRSLFDRADAYFSQRTAGHAIGYLAEAASHCDRHAEARAVLAPYEGSTVPVLAANLRYAHAVLAEGDSAEPLFDQARRTDPHAWPWLRARVDLAWGVWLRRQRRVVESRLPLRSALHAFEALGAVSWAEQARTKLSSAGVDTRSDRSALTPQELHIARLAAAGLSNRQIGQRLFLSHRTVGSHLYKIFPKLNVTSRTQLASRIGDLRVEYPEISTSPNL